MISRETRIGLWAAVAFVALFLLIGFLAFGQAAPELSPVEKIALETVRTEFAKANADLNALGAEIVQAHPGYHFDPNTGAIEKDDPPKGEPKK